jgi:hypothetical protein
LGFVSVEQHGCIAQGGVFSETGRIVAADAAAAEDRTSCKADPVAMQNCKTLSQK